MGRPAAKANKIKPACANKVLIFKGGSCGGFTLYWLGRATPKRAGSKRPAKPRPKPWANLVVFLDDGTRRKRSFHFSWNGYRFSDTADVERIASQEPDLWEELLDRLPMYNYRLIRGRD